VCHDFLNDAKFFQFLFEVDRSIASEVQETGCPCGGVLHSARYPRKPRGPRHVLSDAYDTRLSFCCAQEGCRRRTTPPSVRFLGRKVYLGTMVILITAMQHGLSPKRRRLLMEQFDISPQTFFRWQAWWREAFPASRCWQAIRGQFMPPLDDGAFPGTLLGRLRGHDLKQRMFRFLLLLSPISTTSWSGSLSYRIDPQKM